MTEKLQDYVGWTGRIHLWRDEIKEKYSQWRENGPPNVTDLLSSAFGDGGAVARAGGQGPTGADFSHLYRSKTRGELVRVSSAVMGIEFSYAAETAFVSPTLLKIGVPHSKMTLVWTLSPLVGFFLTPVLGSLSDRCRSNFGRRRPFICLLSIGVLLGLILVPNGESLGYAFGDPDPEDVTLPSNMTNILPHRSTASESNLPQSSSKTSHSWGIFFTILGTVLLDFDADACQSPSRAYLLDVTVPEDHAKGLSTFTIMAGLGGFMGYSLGGINWDDTWIGEALGGHVRAVFTLITIIFIVCVSFTITSFPEIPLWLLESDAQRLVDTTDQDRGETKMSELEAGTQALKEDMATNYGTLDEQKVVEPAPETSKMPKRPSTLPPLSAKDYAALPGENIHETSFMDTSKLPPLPITEEEPVTLQHYLLSIVFMPISLRMVCLTNFFCWSAHVSYSLYFTDFVGEAVYGGDPKAPPTDPRFDLYESGVRFGCWGMAMYSLSCSCYSLIIERLIERFGAKRVYIGGLLFYSTGMTLMAITRHPVGVILFSWTAGVMYSTLFTMPYLLVAHYHAKGVFEVTSSGEAMHGTQVRGLGTDVAIVSSMVFLAQFVLSLCMGTIVSWTGTTTAVVSVASLLAFCGAISATQVMYLDL